MCLPSSYVCDKLFYLSGALLTMSQWLFSSSKFDKNWICKLQFIHTRVTYVQLFMAHFINSNTASLRRHMRKASKGIRQNRAILVRISKYTSWPHIVSGWNHTKSQEHKFLLSIVYGSIFLERTTYF